jgi:hypothetical protein
MPTSASIAISGGTSGTVNLTVPLVAGSGTLTLPAGVTGTLATLSDISTVSVNQASQYAWSNSQSFSNTISFTGPVNLSNTITVTGTPTFSNTVTISGVPTFSNTSTFTGTSSLQGNSTSLAAIFTNAAETINVSATAATGTINYYVNSQSVLYYTTAASANWTVNVAFSSTASLNSALATGQVVTVTFLVTQGGTAYYNNTFKVDNVTVTPKWQGGTAPTGGNVSGIDSYTYTIIKTGSAAFTVLASLTQFK